MYTFRNDSLVKKWELELEGWGPDSLSWASDREVFIKAAKTDENHDYIYDYRRVTFD